MDNNSIDFTNKMGYNDSNLNDDSMIVVKLDEQKAINDKDCKHDQLIPDYADMIGDASYHGCANPMCGVGFYLRSK